MRLFCKWIGIGCLTLALMACASQPSASSKAPANSPKQAAWSKVNPFTWNYRKAGYTLRDKYHFKVGNWWVIKPPPRIDPVLVVVMRTMGALPPWPRTIEPVQQVVHRNFTPTPGTTPESDVVLGEQSHVQEAQITDHQQLVLDLTTGQAAMIDFDGQIYPQQVDNRLVHRVRTLVSDPQWMQQDRIRFPKKADATRTYYRVVFQQADGRTEVRQWTWPTEESLPASLRLLTTAFDVMNRTAHPLSETVNLIK